jgi:hypothetical protein
MSMEVSALYNGLDGQVRRFPKTTCNMFSQNHHVV